jgi:hypothetical protein
VVVPGILQVGIPDLELHHALHILLCFENRERLSILHLSELVGLFKIIGGITLLYVIFKCQYVLT